MFVVCVRARVFVCVFVFVCMLVFIVTVSTHAHTQYLIGKHMQRDVLMYRNMCDQMHLVGMC